jgi:uncharacterized protein (DUF983 family)
MLTVNAYAAPSPSEPLVKTIHHSPRRRCPRCGSNCITREFVIPTSTPCVASGGRRPIR